MCGIQPLRSGTLIRAGWVMRQVGDCLEIPCPYSLNRNVLSAGRQEGKLRQALERCRSLENEISVLRCAAQLLIFALTNPCSYSSYLQKSWFL